MDKLTPEQYKVLMRYQVTGGNSLVPNQEIDKKLIQLGYIEQRLGGLGITRKGQEYLLKYAIKA